MPRGGNAPTGYPMPRLTSSVASYDDGARPPRSRPCSINRSVIASHVAVSSSLMYPAKVASPESTTGAANSA